MKIDNLLIQEFIVMFLQQFMRTDKWTYLAKVNSFKNVSKIRQGICIELSRY